MDENIETNINQTEPVSQSVESNMPIPVPVVAKIISALYYLVSIFLIFTGIMLIFMGSLSLSSFVDFFGFGFGFGMIPGVLAIVWGLFHFFAGGGLWRGKEWGQVLAVTISGLYIAASIIDLVMLSRANNIMTYISITINLSIILYLLFSKSVRIAFSKESSTKTTVIIVALLAILVYGVIFVVSFKEKNNEAKLLRYLQDVRYK